MKTTPKGIVRKGALAPRTRLDWNPDQDRDEAGRWGSGGGGGSGKVESARAKEQDALREKTKNPHSDRAARAHQAAMRERMAAEKDQRESMTPDERAQLGYAKATAAPDARQPNESERDHRMRMGRETAEYLERQEKASNTNATGSKERIAELKAKTAALKEHSANLRSQRKEIEKMTSEMKAERKFGKGSAAAKYAKMSSKQKDSFIKSVAEEMRIRERGQGGSGIGPTPHWRDPSSKNPTRR